MLPHNNQKDHVKLIADRMHLKEGEEAVRRVLISIYRAGKIGTKEIAKDSRLPIPVTAAIRRELERGGLVERRGGAVLSKSGKYYVTSHLGLKNAINSLHDQPEGDYSEKLSILRKIMENRPLPLPELDQTHAIPETSLKRSIYIKENGDLDGRKIIFIGDDDLTSIASGLLGSAKKITVLDVDERLINYIYKISDDHNLKIECIKHDLRYPLPIDMINRYDVFFTDPPYTVEGVTLFLSRGIQSLRPRKTAKAYFAFADKTPLEMLEVNRAINNMGIYISELIPRFNTYLGAEIFANTSSMYRVTLTEETTTAITGVYEGKIYTSEIQPRIRYYRCHCGTEIKIGPKEKYISMRQLKDLGCSKCGIHEGFKLLKRENIQKKIGFRRPKNSHK